MNNRPQKTETYKCDVCEQEFENEEDLKEHAEDGACSETEYKKQDAGDNEGESEEDEELPPLTGEESADDADEDVQEKDNRRSKQERKR